MRYSEKEFERLMQGRPGDSTNADEPLHRAFDSALAIDPGTTTGLAFTDGSVRLAYTTHFWALIDALREKQLPPSNFLPRPCSPENTVVILEAPHLSAPGMRGGNTGQAYSTGRVSRESELLLDGMDRIGFQVVEVDPATNSGKWDRSTAERIIGGWSGQNNEHTRDALRLLFAYSFL
jgi:hypothetical protein